MNNVNERKKLSHAYACANNVFSDLEIEQILFLCNINLKDDISVNTPFDETPYRKSKISFFNRNENTFWIFDKINYYVEQLNDLFFNFDLNGYDTIQFTEYDSQYRGEYKYHMDMSLSVDSSEEICFRKLSFVVLLDKPEKDFSGGKLMFNTSSENECSEMFFEKGSIVVFPSFLIHKVTPVTKGIRRTLVGWILGPKFI